MRLKEKSGDGFPVSSLPKILYHAISGIIHDPFCIIGRDYRLLWLNREWPECGLVGRICYEVYQQRGSSCPDCPIGEVFATNRTSYAEKWVVQRDGSRLWSEIRTYPLADESGDVRHVLKIGHDSTAKKLDQEEQRRYVQSLENTLRKLGKQKVEGLAIRGTPPFTDLSPREVEVLRLLADGLSNRQIGEVLSISAHTVKTHVIHVFNKLGVNGRAQAAVWASRLGLI